MPDIAPFRRRDASIATQLARPGAIALTAALAACAGPPLKPRSLSCVLGVLIAPTVGCESTPLASEALDEQAKRFAPADGVAQIYVARSSIVGSRYLWWVQIDGTTVGTLSVDTYVMHTTVPGPHRITVVSAESRYTVEVLAEDGGTSFVEAVPKMGVTEARAELRLLSVEQGKRLVLGERRVADPPHAATTTLP